MSDTRRLFVFLPFLGVLSLVVYGVGAMAREQSATSSCQSNLKQIGLGFKQYQRDYDEKNVLAENWENALQPYTKKPQIFECPSANNYTLNGHVSRVSDSQIQDHKHTPTVFDSTLNQPNASDFGTSWPKDGAHSLWRRGRGTNVVFYDGHVEWMQQKPKFEAIKPLPTPIPVPPVID